MTVSVNVPYSMCNLLLLQECENIPQALGGRRMIYLYLYTPELILEDLLLKPNPAPEQDVWKFNEKVH